MATLLKLITWLFSRAGGAISGIALAAGLLVGFVYQQQSIGAGKAIVKTEKGNAEARKAADAAARRSLDPDARGVLNPHYRKD